jgi:hypothetical protein
VAASGIISSRMTCPDCLFSGDELEENEWSPAHTYLDIKKPIFDPELDALLYPTPSSFGHSSE